MAAPSQVEEIWKGDFDYARTHVAGGVYNLTMHPQVIGRGHRLLMLERLIGYFKSFGEVRFATLESYVRGWRAANPLDAWRLSGAPQANPRG